METEPGKDKAEATSSSAEPKSPPVDDGDLLSQLLMGLDVAPVDADKQLPKKVASITPGTVTKV